METKINKMKIKMMENRAMKRDKDGNKIDKMRIMGDKRYIKKTRKEQIQVEEKMKPTKESGRK